MLKLLFTAATSTLLIGSLQAQETNTSEMNSNRVGITESSRTVMKGSLMLEGGLQVSRYKYSYPGSPPHNGSINVITGPKLRLGYGITNFMEANVEMNHVKLKSTSSFQEEYSFEYNTYSAGLKFNLTKQKGFLPQTSLSISETYYHNSPYKSYFKTSSTLAWGYRFGEHLRLSGNLIYRYSDLRKSELGLTIKLEYKFNEKIGVFAESYIYDGYNVYPDFNVGVWYKPSQRLLLSLTVGTTAIHNRVYGGSQTSSLSVMLGASFLLNNPDKTGGKKKRK